MSFVYQVSACRKLSVIILAELLVLTPGSSASAQRRGPDPAKAKAATEKAEAEARSIIAGGKASVAAMIERGAMRNMSAGRCQAILTALGEIAHPEIKSALRGQGVGAPGRMRTGVVDTVERMGYLGRPMRGELKAIAAGTRGVLAVSAATAMARVGGDRREAATLLADAIRNRRDKAGIPTIVAALKALGHDAGPAAEALKDAMQKDPKLKFTSTFSFYSLSRTGPAGAPLVGAAVSYLETCGENNCDGAYKFLASVGPGTKSHLSEIKAVVARNRKKLEVALLGDILLACIENKPSGAVARLQAMAPIVLNSRHPQYRKLLSGDVSFSTLTLGVEMLSFHHRPLAARFVPTLIKGLRFRRHVMLAALTLGRMGPAAKPACGPMVQQLRKGYYPDEVHSTIPQYANIVRGARALAQYDPNLLKTLEQLADNDPHLYVRNWAREAVAYAREMASSGAGASK